MISLGGSTGGRGTRPKISGSQVHLLHPIEIVRLLHYLAGLHGYEILLAYKAQGLFFAFSRPDCSPLVRYLPPQAEPDPWAG